jgi:hypothetical protein
METLAFIAFWVFIVYLFSSCIVLSKITYWHTLTIKKFFDNLWIAFVVIWVATIIHLYWRLIEKLK